MKRISCLIFIILISCNSNQVKEVEVLTYYTNAKDYQVYSITDNKGFTKVLFKKEESTFFDKCQLRIRKSLMDSIINTCKNATDKNFVFKSSKRVWYCGHWHSVRVTYENGKQLLFKYPYSDNENKQFIPFQSLNKQVQKDSLLADRLDFGQFGKVYLKQEDLSKLTFKKDSMFYIDINKKR